MIKVVILAPYPDVKDDIEQALREYNPPEPIQTTLYVMSADEVVGTTFQADVIIARGYSAAVLRKEANGQLVVPMQMSAYDVLEGIATAIAEYSPRRVALIGLPETAAMAQRTRAFFTIDIRSYQAPDIFHLKEQVLAARADGCDCFVGGLSLVRVCQEMGEKAVLLRTGKPAVVSSLEEAIRLVQSIREQREKSLGFQTILDNTREGIVSLNHERRVSSINRQALQYLQLDKDEDCLGRRAERLLPFAQEALAAVYGNGKRIENDLVNHADQVFAMDCLPLGRDRQVDGCILFLRSVTRLRSEEVIIRQKIQARGQEAKYSFADIVGRSGVLARSVEKARVYAAVESPVLIVGESGTGKELFAQSIHRESRRRSGPFIGINCAALSETLLESELFGYSDGAFTGALKGGKEGLFEAAHGGTLFLDEISEVPVSFQSKLLRVLQENEVRRLGSQQLIPVDVRIIAATNRDLDGLVKRDLFRHDLFFRLNVLSLHIQPLRGSPEDIMELFRQYTQEYAHKYGKKLGMITREAAEILERHPWIGNVRELKNIAERICVLSKGDVIDAATVTDAIYDENPDGGKDPGRVADPLPDVDEREQLRQLLRYYRGNRGKVAEKLGLNRSTLWRKMKKSVYHKRAPHWAKASRLKAGDWT